MKQPKDKDDRDLNSSGGAGGKITDMKFPALRAFMRSYLHQDFGEEYGSVAEAVKAFCDDATEAEFATVSAEWRAFLEATRGRPMGEINNLLGSKLGSAWNAAGVDELHEITRAFDECASGKG
jgi:contact-dependent growth inhibition (CDI) system CdiI-like immunity protein